MTKKICIIGDSHCAAFKSAWTENAARWPALDVDVFGGHGDTLLKYHVAGDKFVTKDEEVSERQCQLTGHDHLDLSHYDALVLTGLQLSVTFCVRLLRATRHVNLPSYSSKRVKRQHFRPLLSNRLMEQCLHDRLVSRNWHRVTQELMRYMGSAGVKPHMIIASQPRPSLRALTRGKSYNGFRSLLRTGDAAYAEGLFEEQVEKICQNLGAHYLSQPLETREKNLFTAEPFSVGSVRLSKAEGKHHDVDDVLHANAAYAGLVLDQIAAQIETCEDE
jgi:hypothetical protein